jgi:hypothetical protein
MDKIIRSKPCKKRSGTKIPEFWYFLLHQSNLNKGANSLSINYSKIQAYGKETLVGGMLSVKSSRNIQK